MQETLNHSSSTYYKELANALSSLQRVTFCCSSNGNKLICTITKLGDLFTDGMQADSFDSLGFDQSYFCVSIMNYGSYMFRIAKNITFSPYYICEKLGLMDISDAEVIATIFEGVGSYLD